MLDLYHIFLTAKGKMTYQSRPNSVSVYSYFLQSYYWKILVNLSIPVVVKPAGSAAGLTPVKILWGLTSVSTAVRAALFLGWTLSVFFASFHAGSCKPACSLRCWAVALFYHHHGSQKLTAGNTFPVTLGKRVLRILEIFLMLEPTF